MYIVSADISTEMTAFPSPHICHMILKLFVSFYAVITASLHARNLLLRLAANLSILKQVPSCK